MTRSPVRGWWILPVVLATAGISAAVVAAQVTSMDRADAPAVAVQPAVRGLTEISTSSLGTCPATTHDRYTVAGPDGRAYRTWHPQVVPIDTPGGPTCRFGHEHGDDPASSLADSSPPLFGYVATAAHMVEPHEGFKVFVINRGTTNDEGRTATTSTRLMVHMGTGGAARFTLAEHTMEFDLVAPDGHEVHVQGMADTGLAGSICQRDRSLGNANPADDVGRTVVVARGNGCDAVGSLYEIWTLQLDVGAAHVIASTAAFDPITVMNPADRTVAIRTVVAYPQFGTQFGCNRESYHGPVYWYNATGPTRFYTDGHGNLVGEGSPMAIEQYVSRHADIGIPMNQDQHIMKLHRATCGPGLAAQN